MAWNSYCPDFVRPKCKTRQNTHRILPALRPFLLTRRLITVSLHQSVVIFVTSISHEQMKNILLPVAAIMMAFFGISYSACQESKADSKATGSAVQIREDIARFDQLLTELKKIQQANVTAYGQEMGVTSNSNGLELISKQNEILATYHEKLESHRLQLIQADTTNQTRNELQITELENDITALQTDGDIIRHGLNEEVNTKVTK